MGASELFLLPLRLVLLLGGLVVPGAALLRVLRLPFTVAGSFVTSALVLYTVVVGLALLHLPITLFSLSAALVGAIIASLAYARTGKKSDPVAPEETSSFASFTALGWWTPLYAAFWIIVLWRVTTQPLSGPDVTFRWTWLAEQLVRLGSLDFYPPRSAADYSVYAWPESIPPGIASLHAWSYLCAGHVRAIWTSPAVLLQVLALHEFVWRIAFSWGGEAAARRAVLLAAATPLLVWASLIGQETALTALAVCGLLFALLRWQKSHAPGWLVFAAFAAAAGASAREYGLAYPVLGLGVLALMRAPRPALLRFIGVALPLAAIWPLRTWFLTGNPFFSLGVAGLFPTNVLFAQWSADFHAAARGTLFTLDAWRQLARFLLLFAPAALFGTVALVLYARRGLREARWCLACIALSTALWLASVPFTAGGLFYSLRTLSPAFALAAAFGGYAIMAATTPTRRVADLALAVALLATLPFALTLPENAYHLAPREWPQAAVRLVRLDTQSAAELPAALQKLPGHTRVLTDYAGLPRVVDGTDITAVPIWSPEVTWLFDESLSPEDVAHRWRESRLRYVVTSPSPAFVDFLNRRARWKPPLFAVNRVGQTDAFLILEVITEPDQAH